MKSYNIILNSTNGTQLNGSNNEIQYNFDWSILEDKHYNVHFSFVSEVADLNGSKIALVEINLGSNNTFILNNNTVANTTNIIGFVKPYILGSNSFLLSEDNTNPPTYIYNRPYNNIFTIRFIDNDGVLFTPNLGSFPSYILHLRFVPV